MAYAHNCMIRGLNSIYLQAEYVKKTSIQIIPNSFSIGGLKW